MPLGPLRVVFASLIGVGLLLVVFAALTGFLLVLALVVGLAVLNIIYLPRAAARLHIRATWLALVLIPLLVLAGFVVGGPEGAGWGAGMWLVAIGLPRAIGRDLVRRLQRRFQANVRYLDVELRPVITVDATTKPTIDRGERPLPPADDRGRGEYGP
jgi:4-hydroxybenzoate polyprenyltransferase